VVQSPSVPRATGRLRRRRGSNAVEFALTLPILITLLLGLVDYGWFFLRQALIVNAAREAVRAGSLQSPADTDASGQCSTCIDEAKADFQTLLTAYGIPVAPGLVNPTVVAVSGTCALSLAPSIPFTPLAGFVPTPAEYDVNTIMFLQNVTGC